ncbi:DUF6226 family protein [Naasia lichenicola]|uniref:Uncharacterized protein n=1 Tax=Naasia lichenicola TaxID=2565933 RepID=A0A4S4FRG8_9MICO|nr:DUF6226 family protein [Naasia lichenicola]THG32898.1 hypothetical protein E6C64_00535 [Naasia lichenicola]
MSDYVRPAIRDEVFRDPAGRVIQYGDRWKGESPPLDTYSVEANLDRFAPLHAVADALIEHLCSRYLVEAQDDIAHAGGLLARRTDVIRAVRLAPADPDGAPLTFVYTSYPSMWLLAGVLAEFPFPTCSCEACDETWSTQVEQLEWSALVVAAGGFAERVRFGSGGFFGYSLQNFEGGRSGETTLDGFPLDRAQAAKARLDALPDGWKRWPDKA